MDIGKVAKGIFEFLFQDALESTITPLLKFIELVALSPETLLSMPFIDPLFQVMQKIGAAILILLLTWHTTKSMLVGAGIEAEEPHLIAFRTFIAGFLLFFIDDILMKFIEIASVAISMIMETNAESQVSFVDFTLRIVGMNSVLYVILGAVLAFKLIGLMFKMFKRLVVCALIIVCSPLAVATMVSKQTEGFMTGMVKLFVGNIVIQLIQGACFKAAAIVLKFEISGAMEASTFFSVMLLIAIISVMGMLEDILRDISVTVGINRDMGGAMSKVQGAFYIASMGRGFAK